jgi:hypothetical protein
MEIFNGVDCWLHQSYPTTNNKTHDSFPRPLLKTKRAYRLMWPSDWLWLRAQVAQGETWSFHWEAWRNPHYINKTANQQPLFYTTHVFYLYITQGLIQWGTNSTYIMARLQRINVRAPSSVLWTWIPLIGTQSIAHSGLWKSPWNISMNSPLSQEGWSTVQNSKPQQIEQ